MQTELAAAQLQLRCAAAPWAGIQEAPEVPVAEEADHLAPVTPTPAFQAAATVALTPAQPRAGDADQEIAVPLMAAGSNAQALAPQAVAIVVPQLQPTEAPAAAEDVPLEPPDPALAQVGQQAAIPKAPEVHLGAEEEVALEIIMPMPAPQAAAKAAVALAQPPAGGEEEPTTPTSAPQAAATAAVALAQPPAGGEEVEFAVPPMEESTAHDPAAAPRETPPVGSGSGPMPPGPRAPPRVRARARLGKIKQACIHLHDLNAANRYVPGYYEGNSEEDHTHILREVKAHREPQYLHGYDSEEDHTMILAGW